ncbi:protein BYPASS1-LIKE-like [Wolffia australiana]
MPATDYQGSSAPFAALGRSILSIRREQVHSMDDEAGAGGSALEIELDSFQRHVADLFQDLASSSEEFLSISWIRQLLEAFLVCQEEFRAILLSNAAAVAKPPLDRLVVEYLDRSVKALDVCNAIRDGIEQIRQWRRYLEIVLVAMAAEPAARAFGEGQLRRAKKALSDLTVAMIEDKEQSGSVLAHRNRSFGRTAAPNRAHGRSLSWSVSRSWSAARQLQAMASSLAAPRANDVATTSGLAVPVYTMSCVLLFAMSALVSVIPCQDRPLQTHFSAPRGFPWATAMASLHDRILEESKKRDRKSFSLSSSSSSSSSPSSGLMKEIYEMERCSRLLGELVDPAQPPIGGEKEAELRQRLLELTAVCDSLKVGLDPLERQVRDVFHRIVRSRTDGLDCLAQSST